MKSEESAEDKESAKIANNDELKQYDGVYEIAEFWSTLYFLEDIDLTEYGSERRI